MTTWSAGRAGPESLVHTQRLAVAGGAAGLATARELDLPTAIAAASGSAVGAGLVLLAALLVIEMRPARTRRFVPAVGFYLAAIGAGLFGIGFGVAMLDGRFGVRDAHMTVNLLGLVGLVIAGTLPYFIATQARVQRSPRATASSLYTLLVVLVVATTAATSGALFEADALEATGLGLYAAGLVGLLSLLPRVGVKQLGWAGPRLLLLGVGGVWWMAMVAVAAARAASGDVAFDRDVVVPLVVGGFAQIFVGSLAYLGPMLRGGGHRHLTTGFRVARSWLSLVALNVAAGAWLLDFEEVTGVAVAVTMVDVLWRAVRLAEACQRRREPGSR